MDENEKALTASEREQSLALLSSLDFNVPEEWNGADDSALVRRIPGTNVEMRYNERLGHPDAEEDISYHYWAVLVGEVGKLFVVRSEDLGSTDLVGLGIEYDEEDEVSYRHRAWLYCDIDRVSVLSADDADCATFGQTIFTDESQLVVNEIVDQWLQDSNCPDIIWSTLLAYISAEHMKESDEDSTTAVSS